MNISSSGIALIKQFEGLRLQAYQCSAKTWTIGYGHSGKDVTSGMTITLEQAEALLLQDIARFEQAVNTRVTVPLNQNQFDALVSWCYNLGETNLASSTMLKELNLGNYAAVASEMKRWNRAGGQILLGLVSRRATEAALFDEPTEAVPVAEVRRLKMA